MAKQPPSSKKSLQTKHTVALKAYEQRPFPLKGDRSAKTTFAAVGEALSAWESFEAHMGIVFGLLVSTEESLPAFRAYGTVHSSEARQTMIQAAGAAYFHMALRVLPAVRLKDTEDHFKKLVTTSKQFAPRRNEIAHGIVQNTSSMAKRHHPMSAKFPLGHAVYPGYFSTTKRSIEMLPIYAYSSIEVLYYKVCFNDLARSAVVLVTQLISINSYMSEKISTAKAAATKSSSISV